MLEPVRDYGRRHGVVGALLRIAGRLTGSAMLLMVFRVLVGDAGLCPPLLDFAEGWSFLRHDDLNRFASADPSLDLDSAFLVEALARGDSCLGLVLNGVLAAYAWYALGPVPLEGGLMATPLPGYVYMYRAFTAPAFRGRRLYGAGVAAGMQAFKQQLPGFKGIVSCVEWHHHASLNGLERIGLRAVGRLFAFGGRRPRLSYVSYGCRGVFAARIERERRWAPESLKRVAG